MPNQIDSPDEVRLSAGTIRKPLPLLWGIALCALVTLAAVAIQAVEETRLRSPLCRSHRDRDPARHRDPHRCGSRAPRWRAGIAFSAKQLLEVAVALLGASLTFAAIAASGLSWWVRSSALVVLSLAVSYGISRSLGLPVRMSILICLRQFDLRQLGDRSGSAGDRRKQGRCRLLDFVHRGPGRPRGAGPAVADSAIAPDGNPVRHSGRNDGLRRSAGARGDVPAGLVSTQIGTLVKLIRVMMLGPLVACIAVFGRSLRGDRPPDASWRSNSFRPYRGSSWRSSRWRRCVRCRCCRRRRSSRCGRWPTF